MQALWAENRGIKRDPTIPEIGRLLPFGNIGLPTLLALRTLHRSAMSWFSGQRPIGFLVIVDYLIRDKPFPQGL
jgi:hypothetical protein